VPGAGTPADILSPPLLPSPFGRVGSSVVRHKGYYFKMYLPDATTNGDIAGIPEDGGVGVGGSSGGTFPDPNNCEVIWCCYAWPIEPESTGNRCFFINQEGDLLQTLNNEGGTNAQLFYGGFTSVPTYDAAFDSTGANNLTGMGASLGITAQGLAANDTNVWTIVGN